MNKYLFDSEILSGRYSEEDEDEDDVMTREKKLKVVRYKKYRINIEKEVYPYDKSTYYANIFPGNSSNSVYTISNMKSFSKEKILKKAKSIIDEAMKYGWNHIYTSGHIE